VVAAKLAHHQTVETAVSKPWKLAAKLRLMKAYGEALGTAKKFA
jgi:hypothetical protein